MEGAVLNDSWRLKRYLAGEMVEEYEEGRMSRRQMIKTVGRILGVTVVSPTLLASLGCGSPEAGEVELPGEEGAITAYQAQPASGGPFAAILLIHENRGLTEHIMDVARRFAKVGYVGLAADLLSRTGGTAQFADESETTTAISELDQGGVISDMQSSVTWLQQQPYVQEGRIGAIGWCWGGGQAWRLATTDPRLNAVVSFYGINPPLENVPNMQAAVLGIYGEEDSRITDQEPELEEALADAGKTYEMTVFEGANHAFFNDTGERFDPEAAEEAWSETLDWFNQYL